MVRQVRAGLAALGLRSLDELVGRADLLKQRDMKLAKTSALDLSFVTTYAGATGKSSDRRNQCVLSPPPCLSCQCVFSFRVSRRVFFCQL